MSEDVYDLIHECAMELKMTQDALRSTLKENKKLRERIDELEDIIVEKNDELDQCYWSMGL